jgi:hypothetical protein
MALQRGQNSLLESPTGSGKSLALLCAALAWQKKETQMAVDYNMAVAQGLIEPEDAPPGNNQIIIIFNLYFFLYRQYYKIKTFNILNGIKFLSFCLFGLKLIL